MIKTAAVKTVITPVVFIVDLTNAGQDDLTRRHVMSIADDVVDAATSKEL